MKEPRYIIMKATRWPGKDVAREWDAYRGPTVDRAGVHRGKIYRDLDEAKSDCQRLVALNPVGFRVWRIGDNLPLWSTEAHDPALP